MKLGQNIFLVDRNGDITRTIVSSLKLGGFDTLVDMGVRKAFLSFEEAQETAKGMFIAQCSEPGANAVEINAKLEMLESREYREQVFKAPLTRIVPFAVKTLAEDPKAPESYFKPGDRVWAVITPHTHHPYDRGCYRPELFFVLQNTIHSVSLRFDKPGVSYEMRSQFQPEDDIYDEEFTAKRRLRDAVETLTRAKLKFEDVRVVTEKEEAEGNKAIACKTYTRAVEFPPSSKTLINAK